MRKLGILTQQTFWKDQEMNSASADIREMTHEEISDVNGGDGGLTFALVAAGIGVLGLGLKLGYDAGKDLANWYNRRDQEKRAANPER